MAKPTPRCLFVRHGQTEWSKSGQYTSITDLPLTSYGTWQMRRTGTILFGTEYIKPESITYVFTSPRRRARDTVDLVLESLRDDQRANVKIVVDDDLREFEYGDYEGLKTGEILELRKSRGLDKERPWSIWRDGCENGETSEQVGLRLSRVIARIQKIHATSFEKGEPCDVLCFAHGHTLRYFAALWFRLGIEADLPADAPPYEKSYDDDSVENVEISKYRYLQENPNFLLDAGGVGVLSYAHNKLSEPALDLAGTFIIPPEQQSQHD